MENLNTILNEIKNLIKERKYNEAIDICNYNINEYYEDMVLLKAFIYEKQKKYDEALNLCDLVESEKSLVRRISILLDMKRYYKALKLCDKCSSKKIDSLKVKTLCLLCRYDEAINICDNYLDQNDVIFFSQKINIYIKLRKYKQALELCDDSRFKDNQIIQIQKEKINLIYKSKNSCCKTTSDSSIKPITVTNIPLKTINNISYLLTKIYRDCACVDEIFSSNYDEFTKDVLLLCFYNKTNTKKAFEYSKTIKSKYKNTEFKSRINKLCDSLSNKKSFFNIGIYEDVLETYIDFNLTFEHKNEEVVISKRNINFDSVPLKVEKKKEEKKIITIEGKRINTRYNSSKNYNSNSVPKNNENVCLIKDLFPYEVFEIQKYIYSEFRFIEKQKRTVEAWDKFDALINKKSNDIDALKRTLDLFKRIDAISDILNNSNYKKYEKQYKL